jgi:acyl carrier protein
MEKNMEFEKLKKVIADVLNVDEGEITLESTFTDDLGADSLDVFQIIMGIEDEFDVKIDPELAEKITTVGEAVDLLKKAINEG